ncbi:MAG: hypothetical protein JSV88_25240 [Candidatus Aminicenantes bacterium]|nr:MAG: hypothetical protein JSV88_25240 [Candidatus Aminicenantes bacterium]
MIILNISESEMKKITKIEIKPEGEPSPRSTDAGNTSPITITEGHQ